MNSNEAGFFMPETPKTPETRHEAAAWCDQVLQGFSDAVRRSTVTVGSSQLVEALDGDLTLLDRVVEGAGALDHLDGILATKLGESGFNAGAIDLETHQKLARFLEQGFGGDPERLRRPDFVGSRQTQPGLRNNPERCGLGGWCIHAWNLPKRTGNEQGEGWVRSKIPN
jgi:hypothetical protein